MVFCGNHCAPHMPCSFAPSLSSHGEYMREVQAHTGQHPWAQGRGRMSPGGESQIPEKSHSIARHPTIELFRSGLQALFCTGSGMRRRFSLHCDSQTEGKTQRSSHSRVVGFHLLLPALCRHRMSGPEVFIPGGLVVPRQR